MRYRSARICPGAKRPPLMGSEHVSELGVGVERGLREEAGASLGLRGVEAGAMVSPSSPGSWPTKVILASGSTGLPQDEQNLAVGETCAPQLEQNM